MSRAVIVYIFSLIFYFVIFFLHIYKLFPYWFSNHAFGFGELLKYNHKEFVWLKIHFSMKYI